MATATGPDPKSLNGKLPGRKVTTAKFFDYVNENVDWEVTGHSRFSGRWSTKKDYYDATWWDLPFFIFPLHMDPGYKLETGEIIVDAETGWSVVEMKTVGVQTRGGAPYHQHYSWHCRWDTNGKIVEAKAFLDLDHLEKVFGGEQKRQGLV
ncbi:uncharacterized protein C8A04DRAFT_35490 [Dichotomopilus funicola]|uniref:Uncharacterized protein n=1 Tax=Dichotomopilus funicola TaxID=1934379 RepID=A0AAN6ZQY5_9PEZI|nr:hypothetical protein C8A04DRAFT_35490 [Dichotomopilus funicola]